MKKLKAPFTEEQVIALNKYQEFGQFHPFTCSGKPHVITEKEFKKNVLSEFQDKMKDIIGKTEYRRDETCINEGILIATKEGWVCPCGYYKQDWAHTFMAEKIID